MHLHQKREVDEIGGSTYLAINEVQQEDCARPPVPKSDLNAVRHVNHDQVFPDHQSEEEDHRKTVLRD